MYYLRLIYVIPGSYITVFFQAFDSDNHCLDNVNNSGSVKKLEQFTMTETCENCLGLVNSCAYFARQTRKNLPGTAVLGGFQTSSQGALKSIE